MDMLAGAAAMQPGGEFAQPPAGFLAIAEEPRAQFASQTTSVAETLQSDRQEPAQLTEKQQSARSIKPGCRIIQARAGQERMAGLHQIQAWIDVAQRRTPTTLAFR